MKGTWSHEKATENWVLPSPQGGVDPVHQPFELAVVDMKPRSGCVHALLPLKPGRYDFDMAIVDEVEFRVRKCRVILLVNVDANSNHLRGEMQWHTRVDSVRGTWKDDECEWVTEAVSWVKFDDVTLLGHWKTENGSEGGWCEGVVSRVAHQRQWEEHGNAPRALQNAFRVCQELTFRLDMTIWRRVFEYCDVDGFEVEIE